MLQATMDLIVTLLWDAWVLGGHTRKHPGVYTAFLVRLAGVILSSFSLCRFDVQISLHHRPLLLSDPPRENNTISLCTAHTRDSYIGCHFNSIILEVESVQSRGIRLPHYSAFGSALILFLRSNISALGLVSLRVCVVPAC